MVAMAGKAMLAVVAVAALAVQLAAAATDHPVGGDGAWDASGSNYNAWAAKQKFVQGDTVSFTYSPSHDVTEVTEAAYKGCSGSNPVKSYTGGSTAVKLATPGKHYFICSIPGHCAAGMKLEVTVAAAGVSAAPAPTKSKSKPRHQKSAAPAPAPAPDASSTEVSTPTAAPAPKASGAAAVGAVGVKAVVGLAAGVALALAM